MIKCYYDFHIHTALSPCADNDMTPNNIIGMANLKGLDIIAITDHNSAKNVEAVMECAKNTDIIVVPGMEVETAEEVHMLCLFTDLEGVYRLETHIYENLPALDNRVDIFGEQRILDEKDEIKSFEQRMLVTACALSVQKLKEQTEEFGGIVIPAHIDRQAYSIVSNLGFIPPELGLKYVEISAKSVDEQAFIRGQQLDRFHIIHNSDAHFLGDISERKYSIDLSEKSSDNLFEIFRS